MSDNLFNGRRFRALTVVDNFSRECLAIHAGRSLKGEDVVDVMEGLRVLGKRLPVRIQTDNGSEFISKSLEFFTAINMDKILINYLLSSKKSKQGDLSLIDAEIFV